MYCTLILGLAITSASAQGPEAPEAIYVARKIPLQPGLSVVSGGHELVVSGLGHKLTVSKVSPTTIECMRTRLSSPGHQPRFAIDRETGLGAFILPETGQRVALAPPARAFHWLDTITARELVDAVPGRTVVRPSDLETVLPSLRYAGITMLPCRCDGEAALLPCWMLMGGHGSWVWVLADPENPLVIGSDFTLDRVYYAMVHPALHRPETWRVTEIDGPGIELVPLDEWRAK